MKMPKESLRYLIFSEIFQRLGEPKFNRRAFSILECAVTCYARKGLDGVTLEMIAREAGVSRSLIRHYFKNEKEVGETAVRYIRLLFQKQCVDAMAVEVNAARMLDAYIRACFHWVASSRTHVIVWFAHMQAAGKSKKKRELGTLAVTTGSERIAALVRRGIDDGSFVTANPDAAARTLQVLITGALISAFSENTDAEFEGLIRSRCLELAGGRRSSGSV